MTAPGATSDTPRKSSPASMFVMKRRWLLAATTLLAVSCGGGGSGSDPTGPVVPPGVQPVAGLPEAESVAAEQVTAFVIGSLGDQAGLRAVLLAWERGYSHAQILGLGTSGVEVDADGHLLQGGGQITPAESPRGVIDLPAEAPIAPAVAATSGVDATTEALGNCNNRIYALDDTGRLRDKGLNLTGEGRALFMMVAGMELGVGADGVRAMITSAILGLCTEIVAKRVTVPGSSEVQVCSYLIVDRTDVYPSNENAYVCDELTPGRDDFPADDGEPGDGGTAGGGSSDPTEVRVYRRAIDMHLVWKDRDNRLPDYEDSTCDVSQVAELTVRPDGTLTFTLSWTQWIDIKPGMNDSCQTFDETRTSSFEGTWSDAAFTAFLRDPLHFEGKVEFQGQLIGSFAVVHQDIQFSGVAADVETQLHFSLPLVIQ